MGFFRRRRRFKIVICIDRASDDVLEYLVPPTQWPRGVIWWEQLKKATPDQRVPMLLGALAANEVERRKATFPKRPPFNFEKRPYMSSAAEGFDRPNLDETKATP